MSEGQVIVPILIVLAVGIFIGTRIWMMFRKWQRKKIRENQGDYKKEKRREGNNNELRNTSVNNKKRKGEKSPLTHNKNTFRK